MKVRMIVSKIGYPSEGEVVDVGEDRARRWVLDMGLAEFAEKKDRAAAVKKIEEAEKEAARAEKKLDKELKATEEG